jgi:hypothetical protein
MTSWRAPAKISSMNCQAQDPEEKLLCINKKPHRIFYQASGQDGVLVYEAHSLEDDYYQRFKQKQREYIAVIREILQAIMDKHKSKLNINVVTFYPPGYAQLDNTVV